jgi:type I restriction enzyme S subunit
MRITSTKPVLRFPEFKEDWKEYRLSDFLTRYSETNKDEEFTIDDILSLSSHYGIVSRKELLEDTYSNVNHLAYKKTRKNDFVFGKSISASYPYGLFKVNDYKDGLLSTLYFTFKVKENVFPKFLDCYFSHLNRANNFLRKYVLVGDRYITADADYLLSGQIYLPKQKEEQYKIADFLIQVDNRIKQLKEKKENIECYKKVITKKLFSKQLRFKDESGKEFPDWKKYSIKTVLERFTKPVDVNPHKYYEQIGIKSHGKGIFHKEAVTGKILGNKRVFWIEEDKLILNIVFAWERAVAKTSSAEKGKVASHRFPMYKTKTDLLNLDYILLFFLTPRGKKYLELASPGGAGRNKTLGQTEFENLKFEIPSLKEQVKISSFLNAIDKQIDLVSQQTKRTVKFKEGLLQNLFV